MSSRRGNEGTPRSLSSSWSKRCSFLGRQQPSKITSADHVITVVSEPSPRGEGRTTPVPSSPGDTPTPTWNPSSSATAQQLPCLEGSNAVHAGGGGAGAEDSLRTPLLHNQQLPGSYTMQQQAPRLSPPQLEHTATFKASLSKAPVRGAEAEAEAEAAAAAAAAAAAPHGPDRRATAAAAAAAAVEAAKDEAEQFQRKLAAAYTLSWIVNIFLLVAKLYAYWLSSSKAVLASAADSAVDLVSQVVIAYADWRVRREDPRFPVGQARLEAIGVLACACIMSVASFEVINESVQVLIEVYQTGELPVLELGLVMYLVLCSATALKLLCWAVCAALQSKSDSMLALAEDHLNDIMSNVCAILTTVLAGYVPNGWWIDPVGAIGISGYIVARWLAIAKQQVDKIVGRGAPVLFLQQLEDLANSHHAALGLDVIRAYHFGARYIVEMEVVLPADMTVKDSHDISLELQDKVEELDEVERAFVHVDYMKRDGLEHKVERELALAAGQRSQSLGSNGRPSKQGSCSSGTSDDGGAWRAGQAAERTVESLV